jgi:hemoglobin-like flavoprotein
MITSKQISLVKASWSLITPVSKEMGLQFYEQLFNAHPELKPLFKSDPKDQAMKLMFMLSYLVHRLDNHTELEEEIRKLALRHANYKTKPEHYKMVGVVLLSVLGKQLGKEWTTETGAAWQAAYDLISELMIEHQE